MPRPQKCRFVEKHPDVTYFKPQGIPMRDLVEMRLTVDGYEALRLVDYQGLSIEEAAQAMGVSRHIASRVLAEARKAVAETLANGCALRIEGGTYRIRGNKGETNGCTEEKAMTMIAVSSEGPGLDQMGRSQIRTGRGLRHREHRDHGTQLPGQRRVPGHGAWRGHPDRPSPSPTPEP